MGNKKPNKYFEGLKRIKPASKEVLEEDAKKQKKDLRKKGWQFRINKAKRKMRAYFVIVLPHLWLIVSGVLVAVLTAIIVQCL